MKQLATIFFDGESHTIYIYETMDGGWGVTIKNTKGETASRPATSLTEMTDLEKIAHSIGENYVKNAFKVLMRE